MIKTYSALFAGLDGAGMGLQAAGLQPVNLFEYDPRLAELGQANSTGQFVVADVRDVDYRRYEKPDCLWMSPACTRASVANPNAGEDALDRECAAACARAVETWLPPVVCLENVWQYREFDSFKMILAALRQRGYGVDYWHLNAASYGVPQTRKRLILIARRDGRRPRRPEPTHAREPVPSLFGTLERWRGWYEAIEDLLPGLPESKFADWQLERMGDAMASGLIINTREMHGGKDSPAVLTARHYDEPIYTVPATSKPSRHKALLVDCTHRTDADLTTRNGEEPAHTVCSSHFRRPGNEPRALLINGINHNTVAVTDGESPAFTVCATQEKGMPRALLVDSQQTAPGRSSDDRADRTLLTRESQSTAVVIPASVHNGVPKALLVHPNEMRNTPIVDGERGAFTVLAQAAGGSFSPRALIKSGRVVAMTPRALCRFMSIPDSFVLSGHRKTDCIGIGNAVPPLLAQRVIESVMEAG